MIYLDNAATTMHKPQTVIDAVTQAMCSLGNAGRGATSGALDAARTIHGCRAKLARLLGCPRADHVCFTPNSTAALNTAICGVVRPGDRVVTTVLEHNSVLRPLNRLAAEQGVTVEHAGCDVNGALDYDELERLVTPGTRALVVTHASNVTGNAVDIARVAAMAHAAGALVIVDASQSAGTAHIDMHAWGSTWCALPATRLMGPQGTGGLAVAEGIDVAPWAMGGTGVHSFDPLQPLEWPTRLEAGTLNGHGIAGLSAGLDFIEAQAGSRRLLPTSMRSLIASLPVCARFRGLSSTGPLTSRRARRSCRSTWAISTLRDLGRAHARVGDCDAPRCPLRSAHAPCVRYRAPGCRPLLVWVFQHDRRSRHGYRCSAQFSLLKLLDRLYLRDGYFARPVFVSTERCAYGFIRPARSAFRPCRYRRHCAVLDALWRR